MIEYCTKNLHYDLSHNFAELALTILSIFVCVMLFAVNVKWGKEKFTGIECNTDEAPMVFKAQLFALSGVQPDRQKVMMKGMVLKVCWFYICHFAVRHMSDMFDHETICVLCVY